jgi:uncharacterized Zn finger protein (UPF0148 family)
MQPFVCPRCGHGSQFDPMTASAICPRCGYTPPTDLQAMLRPTGRRLGDGFRDRPRRATHQPLLDELLSYWAGNRTPDPGFRLSGPQEVQEFFEDYQQALGEDSHPLPGAQARYVRSHELEQQAIPWFVGALLLLGQGERAEAAQHLQRLTQDYPEFVDPWIWLSATTDDPAQRLDLLETAVAREPAHPLARDALAVAQGRVSPNGKRPQPGSEAEARASQCPQCGGALHYEPGAATVVCPYCNRDWDLREIDLLNQQARLVGDLQLRRRFEGHTWQEARRVVHCQTCGAELTMSHHLSQVCAFCGSANVLIEDARQPFEQPDGFLPFQIDRQQARAGVETAQRSTRQRLKTLWSGQEPQVKRIVGVYLPFWVLDGFVEVRLPLERPSIEGPVNGLWPYLPRYAASFSEDNDPGIRTDLVMVDNLLYAAAQFPPPRLLEGVKPFELGGLVPYEPHLLADWPAALYHRDVEMVLPEARKAMLIRALQQTSTPSGQSDPSFGQSRRTYQVTTIAYQLILLPVWLALAQHEQERRLALVNGQTGHVALSTPLRRPRA